jgi:hypothetical protein
LGGGVPPPPPRLVKKNTYFLFFVVEGFPIRLTQVVFVHILLATYESDLQGFDTILISWVQWGL